MGAGGRGCRGEGEDVADDSDDGNDDDGEDEEEERRGRGRRKRWWSRRGIWDWHGTVYATRYSPAHLRTPEARLVNILEKETHRLPIYYVNKMLCPFFIAFVAGQDSPICPPSLPPRSSPTVLTTSRPTTEGSHLCSVFSVFFDIAGLGPELPPNSLHAKRTAKLRLNGYHSPLHFKQKRRRDSDSEKKRLFLSPLGVGLGGTIPLIFLAVLWLCPFCCALSHANRAPSRWDQ